VATEGLSLPLAAGVICVEPGRLFRKSAFVTTAAVGGSTAKITLSAFQPEKRTRLSLRMALRSATAVDHEIVDAAFARFDLTSAESYEQFLMAHANVLRTLEADVAGLWSSWRPRFPLLQADLADLGVAVSASKTAVARSDAERWGILYVLEGSRLGGDILSGRVASGLPVRYLSAAHEAGSWRLFGEALEQAGALQDDDWHEAVTNGAKLTFGRFAMSAAEVRP
jgi:heme oxygenase